MSRYISKLKKSGLFLLITLAAVGCNRKDSTKKSQAYIDAHITVADSIDASGDYSEIQLLILEENIAEDKLDTLFAGSTNVDGYIIGSVEFPRQGLYPALISRNGTNLLFSQIILADKDTLRITGELPGIAGNFKVDSREERAAEVFGRVELGFNRTADFIRVGAVADSLIPDEIFKWSDLFWQVHEERSGTIAANLGAQRAVEILEDFDNELLEERLNSSLKGNDAMIAFASDFGKRYTAERRGLDAAVKYLDSLKSLATNANLKQNLDRAVIKMYYDSLLTSNAQTQLDAFKSEYKKDERALNWAERTQYDLTYLSHGKQVPDFSFVSFYGDTISNASLTGSVYILEITPVTSQMYKDQFERSAIIKQIYSPYNLEFYTIPLERSEITVDAFFEEREYPWPAAKPGSFEVEQILTDFNVAQTPVRLLIDTEGKIERKYIGDEFDDIFKGLNRVFSGNEAEE